MDDESSAEKSVAKRIDEACMNSVLPVLRGSQIGAMMPDIRFRDTYGSLGAFITQYCPDVIQCGKQGGDLLFTHKSRMNELGTESYPKVDTTSELWRAFTNPKVSSRLFADVQTGKLLAVAQDQAVPEGFVEVKSMTIEDYRAMAASFIESHQEIQEPMFHDIIAGDAFWFPFSSLIKSKYPDAYKHLLDFRILKIWETLESRLCGAGMSQETYLKARMALRKADEAPSSPANRSLDRSSAPSERKSDRNSNSLQPRSSQGEASRLTRFERRDLACRILDAMSDEAIDNIWVPLGSVFRAIYR